MDTVKVVVIGPESTGKSTLTEFLAKTFSAPFVAEYAREYLQNRSGKPYELADLENVAKEQVKRTEKIFSAKPPLLFCDTDLVTLHIWALDKFDQTIDFVEENLATQKGDFYLLCKPDLPWESDPLREDSTRRDLLFDWNRRVLDDLNATYQIISGKGDYRNDLAIKALNDFLPKIT